MIDPETGIRLDTEQKLHRDLRCLINDRKRLRAENKRLRAALERIRDSQESDLSEYATFVMAEAIAALEGGQG